MRPPQASTSETFPEASEASTLKPRPDPHLEEEPENFPEPIPGTNTQSNPKPFTQNRQPETPNPEPHNSISRFYILKPSPLYPKPKP